MNSIARPSLEFRKRHFPAATARDWNDWRWQMRNRLGSCRQIEQVLRLTPGERQVLQAPPLRLPVAFTPYYASLLDPENPLHPLRRCVIPSLLERQARSGEFADPLGEDAHSPAPGLIHTYPDKALFLVTDYCPAYCRFCTRSRVVGRGQYTPRKARWEKALAYIRQTPAIRDVLLSGGEPLSLPDESLEWLLARLSRISHVEIIRIGTKAPAVLPQRITPELVRLLRRFHPLWMSVHFTHPEELTPEAERACARLADAGIPLCSQTVLLKGINDDLPAMKKLLLGLLRFRVKPYYLHQCDAVLGAGHFRTSVACGQELIRALHGQTTGYAVPAYMIDAPGGGGKVPVTPGYIEGRKGKTLILRNYLGKKYRYTEGA